MKALSLIIFLSTRVLIYLPLKKLKIFIFYLFVIDELSILGKIMLIKKKRKSGCETLENSNFLKNGKIVISVKIQNFARFWMTKRISPLESSREI